MPLPRTQDSLDQKGRGTVKDLNHEARGAGGAGVEEPAGFQPVSAVDTLSSALASRCGLFPSGSRSEVQKQELPLLT